MKYYFDTEFLEGPQEKRFLGIPYGKTAPTIDLISIGIVAQDGREYYAISKDFNLEEAWNRHDQILNRQYPLGPWYIDNYWIRDNVLRPIWKELSRKSLTDEKYCREHFGSTGFNYKDLKTLISYYGKTNEQIAKEIRNFVMCEKYDSGGMVLRGDFFPNDAPKPEFYGYFADYDWVVFCWLFGRMIDLPQSFPKYCRDLKQIADTLYDNKKREYTLRGGRAFISSLREHPDYPKNTGAHNAMEDARWNMRLHKFLMKEEHGS